jgi:hypothetical protein
VLVSIDLLMSSSISPDYEVEVAAVMCRTCGVQLKFRLFGSETISRSGFMDSSRPISSATHRILAATIFHCPGSRAIAVPGVPLRFISTRTLSACWFHDCFSTAPGIMVCSVGPPLLQFHPFGPRRSAPAIINQPNAAKCIII